MEFKKLVASQYWLPSHIDADNRLHFAGERNAPAPTTGGGITRAGVLAIATGGANVEVSLPAFEVRLIADKRDSITHPAKKLDVIARAKDFLGLVVNIINSEDRMPLSGYSLTLGEVGDLCNESIIFDFPKPKNRTKRRGECGPPAKRFHNWTSSYRG